MWRLREWKSISIHAPTRGATNPLLVLCSLAIIFQSTLPREERHIPHHTLYYIKIFQSTLPREERHITVYPLKYYCRYFNPRSHERSDFQFCFGFWFCEISIHAPTRGATSKQRNEKKDTQISIHAPTRGATSPKCEGVTRQGFQSTLPREERHE